MPTPNGAGGPKAARRWLRERAGRRYELAAAGSLRAPPPGRGAAPSPT